MHQIPSLLLQPPFLAEWLHPPRRLHLPESPQGWKPDHQRGDSRHRPDDRHRGDHHGARLPGLLRSHPGEPLHAAHILRQPPRHLHPPAGARHSGSRGGEEGEGMGEGAPGEVHPVILTTGGREERPGETTGRAEVLRPRERAGGLGHGSQFLPLQRHRAGLRPLLHVLHALLHPNHPFDGEKHGGGAGNRLRHRHPADLRDGLRHDSLLPGWQEGHRHHCLNTHN